MPKRKNKAVPSAAGTSVGPSMAGTSAGPISVPRCPECGDMCLVLNDFGGVCTACHAKRQQKWASVREQANPAAASGAVQAKVACATAERNPQVQAAVKLQAAARGRRVRRWVKGQLMQREDGKLDRKPSRGLLRSASALVEKHLSRPSKSHPGRQSHREPTRKAVGASGPHPDVRQGKAGKEKKTTEQPVKKEKPVRTKAPKGTKV